MTPYITTTKKSVITNVPIQLSSTDCIFTEPTISAKEAILEALFSLTAEEMDTWNQLPKTI